MLHILPLGRTQSVNIYRNLNPHKIISSYYNSILLFSEVRQFYFDLVPTCLNKSIKL